MATSNKPTHHFARQVVKPALLLLAVLAPAGRGLWLLLRRAIGPPRCRRCRKNVEVVILCMGWWCGVGGCLECGPVGSGRRRRRHILHTLHAAFPVSGAALHSLTSRPGA